mgnify:CR=1 FL=1
MITSSRSEQRARGGVAHPIDLLVDGRLLLDVGIGARHVALRAGSSRSRRRKYSTALLGKKPFEFAVRAAPPAVLLGARTSAGRCVRWITCAMVKVLPEPVTPSSTWLRSIWFTPSTNSVIACGWSPFGSYSALSSRAIPPSDFSGRGGRCGMNIGMPPDTSGCVGNASAAAARTSRARWERSCGRASSALRTCRHVRASARAAPPGARPAGSICPPPSRARARRVAPCQVAAAAIAAWRRSAETAARYRLAVAAETAPGALRPWLWPSAWSQACRSSPRRESAGGLPDLPREGRGRGWVSLGRRGMGKDIWFPGRGGNRGCGPARRLLTRQRAAPAQGHFPLSPCAVSAVRGAATQGAVPSRLASATPRRRWQTMAAPPEPRLPHHPCCPLAAIFAGGGALSGAVQKPGSLALPTPPPPWLSLPHMGKSDLISSHRPGHVEGVLHEVQSLLGCEHGRRPVHYRAVGHPGQRTKGPGGRLQVRRDQRRLARLQIFSKAAAMRMPSTIGNARCATSTASAYMVWDRAKGK